MARTAKRKLDTALACGEIAEAAIEYRLAYCKVLVCMMDDEKPPKKLVAKCSAARQRLFAVIDRHGKGKP